MGRMHDFVAGALAFSVLAVPHAARGQTSPSDFTSATRYDAERRVTGTIAPDPDGTGPLHYAAVRNSYDPAGRLVTVEKGELTAWPGDAAPVSWGSVTTFTVLSQIDTTYDALGRKLKDSVSSGGATYQVTQYSYDSFGRLECTAVRMQQAVFGSLPASACSQSVSAAPFDRITRNVYDAAGQLLQVRKGVGTSLDQAYLTYSYTSNGKQEFVLDANGNKARLVYDGHDRQVQWQFPSNAAPPAGYNPSTPANALATAGAVNTNDREEYGYDANGNRTSLRKRDGRVFTYGYDALNRLTSKIVPDACVSGYACTNVSASATRDVYYGYDLRGLQTSARFDGPGGTDAVINAYDGFGRLSTSGTSMAGVSRTLSYLYDADGNRVRISHPDATFFNYYREGLGRIYYVDRNGGYPLFYPPYRKDGKVSVLYRLNSSTGDWGNYSAYEYDGISRLTSITNVFANAANNFAIGMTYNPASQIVSRTKSNNTYAFSGYVSVSRSYAPNGLNQYAAVGGNSYGYDANGNLTSDGSVAYTYDAENRLVATSAGASLTYDPLGRLFQTYKASTGTTQFLYDGDQLTAEYDGAGNLLRRYVHGDGEDDPLVWYEGASVISPRYLYSDHQGSIVGVTDASGNVIKVNAYDEYGIPNLGNDLTTAGRFQYTGQAWLPEIGMYYYKARIYSPTLGRFLQTDPIGYDDQINLYTYVANDPLNHTDPSGRCIEDLCIGEAILLLEALGYAAEALEGSAILDGAAIAARSAMVTTGAGVTAARIASGPLKGMTRSEAAQLIGRWSKGTFNKVSDSLVWHARKRFDGNVASMLRKANSFNYKGAARSLNRETGNVTFRRKNGEFIILDSGGKILSYGAGKEFETGSRIRK